jgi:hypothetical protein
MAGCLGRAGMDRTIRRSLGPRRFKPFPAGLSLLAFS